MDYYKLLIYSFPLLLAFMLHSYWLELSVLLKSGLYGEPRVDLVVGVVSSRDHWLERQAIRDTWMGHAAANESIAHRISMKFIVGTRACLVPPLDREDVKSCKQWNRQYPEKEAYTLISEQSLETPSEGFVHNYAVQRMNFKVLHPIIMNQLGIHAACLRGRLAVRLLDSQTEKEIVSAEFRKEENSQLSGFVYKEVQTFMLPKGFEGILVGENLDSSNPELTISFHSSLNLTVDTSSGYIQVMQPAIPSVEFYVDPNQLMHTQQPVVSFVYHVHEREELVSSLDTIQHRRHEWQQAMEKEDEKLRKEQEMFGDIIFVDTVDVYSNITEKLIKFHEWADQSMEFTWLLKTDDDCYVDVEKIYDVLLTLPREQLWWGRFRHNWAVEQHGKWAELVYPSAVYPSFACGAGNVLSRDLVHWIVRNARMLHRYQGEDTSLGIWLAAVHPQYLDDPRWQCEGECLSDMYVMPQLHHTELHLYWNNRQLCGDPCGCS